jgi:hypothetical protein
MKAKGKPVRHHREDLMKRSVVRIALIAATLCACSLMWFSKPSFSQELQRTLSEAPDKISDLRARLEAKEQQGVSAHVTRADEETLNAIGRAVQRSSQTKAIYQFDDRKDYNRVGSAMRRAADTTVILVNTSDLTLSQDHKTFGLPGGNIINSATGRGLCNEQQCLEGNLPVEAFYWQANPGFCSGFRIGKQRIVTAGHCIQSQERCNATRFVFGFYVTARRPHPEKRIPVENVYRCMNIVGGVEVDSGADWRVVEVDREIKFGTSVTLRKQGTPKRGDGVTVIGYPLGLPVKIAGNANVRSIGSGFFVADLDTYEGNSGSAVFNTEKLSQGELFVEGVLVRGENDFSLTDPCYASKWCPVDGCRGEDVTLATEIVKGLSP